MISANEEQDLDSGAVDLPPVKAGLGGSSSERQEQETICAFSRNLLFVKELLHLGRRPLPTRKSQNELQERQVMKLLNGASGSHSRLQVQEQLEKERKLC